MSPFAVHDLPAGKFPFTVEFWTADADRRGPATWTGTADGPGGMQIPGLGAGTWCRITFADGERVVQPPPGHEGEPF